MPTDVGFATLMSAPATDRRKDIASVRILRLALGTGLCLWFSQAFAWDLSFVAPVFTMMVLSLPLPPLPLQANLKFVVVLMLTAFAGVALLPLLMHARAAGVLVLALALFASFYYTARGGSMLVGTFATVGLGLSTAIGSVSVDAVFIIIKALFIACVVGLTFARLAHALLPDSSARPPALAAAAAPPTPPPPLSLEAARSSALRSLCIVLPISLWFLFSAASASFFVVMIKVAQMGQQSSVADARQAAKSFLASTLIGGIAATIAWQVLRIWPNVVLYSLLVALAGLVMGPRIFAGRAMHPMAATWSYGYVTMLIVLAPAVLDNSGDDAGSLFTTRLLIFVGATIYGVVAVRVYDAFHPPSAG